MTKAFGILVALLLLRSATPALGQADKVAAYVNDFIQRRHIPGVTIAVVKDGKIIHSAGYGESNIELSVLAGENTVYEIGSISKQFTAAATLLLAEQGRLSLDDPVSKYIPSAPAAWSGITIRHLVTHTSGLPDWESKSAFSYRGNYTSEDFLKLVAPLPLDFPPGERFSYTNTGAPVLGMIIEKASGEDFEHFVTEHLFRPAGMEHARYKHFGDVVQNRSGGYVDEDGALHTGEPARPRVIAPSGGIMATAPDLAKWMVALADGSILKPATLQQMNQPVRLNSGRTFSAGMGWFIDSYHGHPMFLHNGSTVTGFSSVIFWFPRDRLGVAALMNIDRFNAVNVLATRVADFFVPGLSPVGLPDRPDPEPALSRSFLNLLAAVADNLDSELLAPNLRNPGGKPRTNPGFGFKGTPDRFAFLEREDVAPGTEHFGNTIKTIYRYRLVTGTRTIYYTFELTPDGKVARFLPEEG